MKRIPVTESSEKDEEEDEIGEDWRSRTERKSFPAPVAMERVGEKTKRESKLGVREAELGRS